MRLSCALLLVATGRPDHAQPSTEDGVLDGRQESVFVEDLKKVAGTIEAKLGTTDLYKNLTQASVMYVMNVVIQQCR